jgi:histidine triad (HIT) family protein
MDDTVFGKILRGEIPADVVYEDDRCMAFRDVNPQAPVHILVIPKDAIVGIQGVSGDRGSLLGHLLLIAAEVARIEGISETGYRCVINAGPDGGQEVQHLHVHVLGGRRMSWPPG